MPRKADRLAGVWYLFTKNRASKWWDAIKGIYSIVFRIGFTGLLIIGGGIAVLEHVFPERWLAVEYGGWNRDAQGHLKLNLVTLRSTHSSKVKDFVVACDAIGNSGTVIETVKSTTLYESLNPRAQLTVLEMDLGPVSDQTSTINCRVSGAQSFGSAK